MSVKRWNLGILVLIKVQLKKMEDVISWISNKQKRLRNRVQMKTKARLKIKTKKTLKEFSKKMKMWKTMIKLLLNKDSRHRATMMSQSLYVVVS